jgi:hypothetical protein
MTPATRTAAGVAGLLLVYPSLVADVAGFFLLAIVVPVHLARVRSR